MKYVSIIAYSVTVILFLVVIYIKTGITLQVIGVSLLGLCVAYTAIDLGCRLASYHDRNP